MNSVLLGIYKKKNVDTENIVSSFSINGFRKINQTITTKLTLYSTSNDFCFENDTIILYFSGNPTFEIDFERYCQDFDLTNIKVELLKVSGVFSFCMFQKDTLELFVANDYFGLYPIFVYEDKDVFIFCNEYNPIVSWNEKSKIIDKKAINEYFNFGFILVRKTFFKNIKNLKPRSLVSLVGSKAVYQTYETYNPIEKEWTEDECLELIYSLLKRFVDHFYSTNLENKVATLTGGLDSRLILGLVDVEQRTKINYFSFYLEPLNETNDKDVLVAKMLADFFKLKLEVTNMSEKTMPLDDSYFNQIRKDSNETFLTGLYGGEFLTGLLYKNVIQAETENFIKRITNKKSPNRVLYLNNSLQKEYLKVGKRMFYFDVLVNNFFTSVYLGTEGSWVHPWLNQQRYVSPFLDTAFLKAWFSMPDKILFEDTNLIFKLYQKFFPNLMRFPTNSTLPGLQEAGFNYMKEGIEPRIVKKKKYLGDMEELKSTKGYKKIPAMYKNKKTTLDENKRQRIIDFCTWYSYIDQIG